MKDKFIRFRNYKNRVALRFRVRCVSALKVDSCNLGREKGWEEFQWISVFIRNLFIFQVLAYRLSLWFSSSIATPEETLSWTWNNVKKLVSRWRQGAERQAITKLVSFSYVPISLHNDYISFEIYFFIIVYRLTISSLCRTKRSFWSMLVFLEAFGCKQWTNCQPCLYYK